MKHLSLAVFIGAFFSLTGLNALAVTEKVVISGMDRPWAVVRSPDDQLWISEKRSGKILIYSAEFKLQRTLKNLPEFSAHIEGGLLDLAFHPNFKSNKYVFAAYTTRSNGMHRVQIHRFSYEDGALKKHKVIFTGPLAEAGHHFGSRLLFDDQGYLLATFGERLEKEKSQDMQAMHGKIVRITHDGEIPANNPFGPNSPIYSLGHRNPQGLAIHPISRRIYDSEHGPSGFDAPGGGDEINEIFAGANYGWPNYHHTMTAPGMMAPLLEYTPSIAPSGIAFYTGQKISAWTNDLFVAALKGQHLLRVRISSNGQVGDSEILLQNKYGRLRDVETAPDGSLVVIAEDGRLVQLKL